MYKDLRAYVCTFQDCDDRLFEDRHTWFQHELDAHRRQWTCQYCLSSAFDSSEHLTRHLLGEHPQGLPDGDVPLAILVASSHPATEIEASGCPLCDEWFEGLQEEAKRTHLPEGDQLFVSLKDFQRHLGQHQEQLALHAIPPSAEYGGDSDSDSGDDVSKAAKRNALQEWQGDAADAVAPNEIPHEILEHIDAIDGLDSLGDPPSPLAADSDSSSFGFLSAEEASEESDSEHGVPPRATPIEPIHLPIVLERDDIRPFAVRAAGLFQRRPVMTYWLNYYIVKRVLSRQLHTNDEDCQTYTSSLLSRLETFKAANLSDPRVTDDGAAKAYVKQSALEVLQRADEQRNALQSTRETADSFTAAATFLDMMSIWGDDVEDEIRTKSRYAKLHAHRILHALNAGQDPNLIADTTHEAVLATEVSYPVEDQQDEDLRIRLDALRRDQPRSTVTAGGVYDPVEVTQRPLLVADTTDDLNTLPALAGLSEAVLQKPQASLADTTVLSGGLQAQSPADDVSGPVSEALLPIFNQLQTLKRCLLEVKENGGVESPGELYPYSMKLNSIDKMRIEGKFRIGNSVPESQEIVLALLDKCFELSHELRLDVEEASAKEADPGIALAQTPEEPRSRKTTLDSEGDDGDNGGIAQVADRPLEEADVLELIATGHPARAPTGDGSSPYANDEVGQGLPADTRAEPIERSIAETASKTEAATRHEEKRKQEKAEADRFEAKMLERQYEELERRQGRAETSDMEDSRLDEIAGGPNHVLIPPPRKPGSDGKDGDEDIKQKPVNEMSEREFMNFVDERRPGEDMAFKRQLLELHKASAPASVRTDLGGESVRPAQPLHQPNTGRGGYGAHVEDYDIGENDVRPPSREQAVPYVSSTPPPRPGRAASTEVPPPPWRKSNMETTAAKNRDLADGNARLPPPSQLPSGRGGDVAHVEDYDSETKEGVPHSGRPTARHAEDISRRPIPKRSASTEAIDGDAISDMVIIEPGVSRARRRPEYFTTDSTSRRSRRQRSYDRIIPPDAEYSRPQSPPMRYRDYLQTNAAQDTRARDHYDQRFSPLYDPYADEPYSRRRREERQANDYSLPEHERDERRRRRYFTTASRAERETRRYDDYPSSTGTYASAPQYQSERQRPIVMDEPSPRPRMSSLVDLPREKLSETSYADQRPDRATDPSLDRFAE